MSIYMSKERGPIGAQGSQFKVDADKPWYQGEKFNRALKITGIVLGVLALVGLVIATIHISGPIFAGSAIAISSGSIAAAASTPYYLTPPGALVITTIVGVLVGLVGMGLLTALSDGEYSRGPNGPIGSKGLRGIWPKPF